MILMVLINGKHKDNNRRYDPNGFNIYRLHEDTDDIYNPNGFDINAKHKVLMIYMILMVLI